MRIFKKTTLAKALPWLLVIGGTFGLLSSFIITTEKIHLAENPGGTTICDLNPVVSCGSVMSSDQSAVFGFPNSIIGLVAFSILICVGMSLLAGAQFKRWYWLGLQAGTVFGLVFVHWLMSQSLYAINALCPFCMVVWVVTITSFWYVLLYNIQQKHIVVRGRLATVAAFARKHHLDILLFWFVVIAALILHKFWYYYGPMLGF